MEKGKRYFGICAFFAVGSVLLITVYLLLSGLPALGKIRLGEFLFGTEWFPTKPEPKFGIFYILLTSVIGTTLAIGIGVPLGVFTAIFLAEIASKRMAALVKPAVELLAGIPSVIYGLIGVMILNPLMYRIELWMFRDSQTHSFTGGSNLISAVFVLAIMILPTVVNISEASIRAVPASLRQASLGLGATKIQTIFKVVLPAAKSGITAAVVLGVGRAIGEAMAITLVSGSAVNLPLPFSSVRFLTTAIVAEMGYAQGLHRQVLFTIGLVLFLFIVGINFVLTRVIKKQGGQECEHS